MQPKTPESLRAFLSCKIASSKPNPEKNPQIITFSPYNNALSISKRMKSFKQKPKSAFNSLEKENINFMRNSQNKKNEINEKLRNLLDSPLKSSDRISSLYQYQKMKNKSSASCSNLPLIARRKSLELNSEKTKNESKKNKLQNGKKEKENNIEQAMNLELELNDDLRIKLPAGEENKELRVERSNIDVVVAENECLMNSEHLLISKSSKVNSRKGSYFNDKNNCNLSSNFAAVSEEDKELKLNILNNNSSNVKINVKFNFSGEAYGKEKSFLNFKRTREEKLAKNFNNSIKSNLFNKNILTKKTNQLQKEQEIIQNSPSVSLSNLKSPSIASLKSQKSLKELSQLEKAIPEFCFEFEQIKKEITETPEAIKNNYINKIKEINELFKLPSKKFDWSKLLNLTNLTTNEFNTIKNCICYKKYLGKEIQFILLKAYDCSEDGLYFKIDPSKGKYYLSRRKINKDL